MASPAGTRTLRLTRRTIFKERLFAQEVERFLQIVRGDYELTSM
jgi:hypothetical protein